MLPSRRFFCTTARCIFWNLLAMEDRDSWFAPGTSESSSFSYCPPVPFFPGLCMALQSNCWSTLSHRISQVLLNCRYFYQNQTDAKAAIKLANFILKKLFKVSRKNENITVLTASDALDSVYNIILEQSLSWKSFAIWSMLHGFRTDMERCDWMHAERWEAEYPEHFSRIVFISTNSTGHETYWDILFIYSARCQFFLLIC